MVTTGDICITAMMQSRLDQELLALEMFGFFALSVPGPKAKRFGKLHMSAARGRPEIGGVALDCRL
jgi:hypothetical protein